MDLLHPLPPPPPGESGAAGSWKRRGMNADCLQTRGGISTFPVSLYVCVYLCAHVCVYMRDRLTSSGIRTFHYQRGARKVISLIKFLPGNGGKHLIKQTLKVQWETRMRLCLQYASRAVLCSVLVTLTFATHWLCARRWARTSQTLLHWVPLTTLPGRYLTDKETVAQRD